ncbi:peptidylprolyl isomerase [Nitrospirillum amazonense]|uniref:peptidylprolyl isomerase n=1 Tax=Nitrospirillum amazonense TaxID=28077 RepID=UPI002DD42942|nr:peptidylprolyl isomerase [Nitrospirillum amazonense]MEC4594634.1 peptidylprolyl isomerase [Nitrospirillum amazonense]
MIQLSRRSAAAVLAFGLTLGTSLATPALAQLAGPRTAAATNGMALGPRVAAQPQGQQEERIVAVVNDEAISQTDLAGRMRLAIVNTGLPDTPDVEQKLKPQVLRLLIDEKLELQEAKKQNLVVTDEEVDREFARLAKQNKAPSPESFAANLEREGVPVAALKDQMRANIAWNKVVQRRIRPTIQVSDEEIDSRTSRIIANAGKPEYLLTEIFISVDNPKLDQDAHQLADKLVGEITHGANFAAVAQQFSQSATAAAGGDMGWVQQGQLEPALDRALQRLPTGQVSVPLRGAGGYYIFLVRDERTVTGGDPADIQVSVGQVVVPVPPGADVQTLGQTVKKIGDTSHSCEALAAAAKANLPGSTTRAQPMTRLGDIPGELAKLIGRLGVGQATDPLETQAGLMLLMVCDRKVPEGSAPPRDQVANMIGGERMDMLQRRNLRDLRRAATIDIRS